MVEVLEGTFSEAINIDVDTFEEVPVNIDAVIPSVPVIKKDEVLINNVSLDVAVLIKKEVADTNVEAIIQGSTSANAAV